jgi:hypothetical protein
MELQFDVNDLNFYLMFCKKKLMIDFKNLLIMRLINYTNFLCIYTLIFTRYTLE